MSDFEVHPVGTGALLSQLHASAPEGCKCADCTIDQEACPACYAAWWKAVHPNTRLVEPRDMDTIRACWDAVNTCIAKGPLSGDGCDQTAERNGLILATNILASMLPDWEADPGQELRKDEIRMVSNPGSEVPDWFRKVMLDNSFRSYNPPIMDAEPMTKAEIKNRRIQGEFMHRFGSSFLAINTDEDIPIVLVGNPEQTVIVTEEV